MQYRFPLFNNRGILQGWIKPSETGLHKSSTLYRKFEVSFSDISVDFLIHFIQKPESESSANEQL